ncbi:hypothetical protein BURKHO8Y_210302 [Burkholderia sp. 8Y]|nr:hypothetical protein BURKHO8Y_210302 [Burkholderia sp. 8Y]
MPAIGILSTPSARNKHKLGAAGNPLYRSHASRRSGDTAHRARVKQSDTSLPTPIAALAGACIPRTASRH